MIETDRLVLRSWREEDRAPFAVLNADPEVMRHFPAPFSREQSDAAVDRMIAHQAEHGFCFWAVERKTDGAFLGFNGLKVIPADAPLGPGVEIGWRYARFAWGQGLASEGARAALAWGFDTLDVPQIVAYTTTTNDLSEAVMVRVGMTREAGRDFDHPAIRAGHPLRRHIVYAARRPG